MSASISVSPANTLPVEIVTYLYFIKIPQPISTSGSRAAVAQPLGLLLGSLKWSSLFQSERDMGLCLSP